MELSWDFTCGTEIFGIIVCLIIYYSCMYNHEAYGNITDAFSGLLITSSLNLLLDEWSWLVQGVPERRLENMVSNVLLYINTYTMGLLFWIYAVNILDVRTKLVKKSTSLFILLYIIASLICILNIFVPIYFSIDSDGVYRRAPLYIFRTFCYIALIPGIVEVIMETKTSLRDKLTTASFLILPIMAEILSFFKFGMSMKPTASMLAIVLNYMILVTHRERSIARTQNGLQIASQIQEGILPKDLSDSPGKKNYDIYASMTPAQEVGGDFYDYFMIDDDHLAILVADVSDKGLGAAFFVMIAKILIKSRAEMGGKPSEIIKYVDDQISASNSPGLFVTVWFAIIDLSTGHVDVCNAGHDYPALMLSAEGFSIEKSEHGPPIAFLPGMPFPEISFDMKSGDRIFLYTDGLTEAKRHDAARFGTGRMLEVLNRNLKYDNKTLIEAMKYEVDKFTDGEMQFDDITMLGFTFK